MSTIRAEQVEAPKTVTAEAAALSSQVMTQADNTALVAVRAANAQNLKDSGVLPDIELVQKNFKDIDQSHDGFVTKKEIEDYVKSHKDLTKEEVAALTRVGDQVEKLQKLSNDEWGRENSGVTMKDLNVASENAKAMDYAQRNFAKLDGDGNGHITKSEIDAYMKANGDKLSAEDRANLEVLKKNYSKIEDYSNDEWGIENDGITRHDLIEGRKQEGTDTLKTGVKDSDSTSAYGDLRPALDYAQKNFDKIDADHNGFISKDDIDKYIQDNKGKLSTEELQNLRALKENVSKVEDMNNDEWGPETKGMSKKDIAAAKEEIDTLAYAQKNFDKLDGNGDGHVTADEIEGYIRAKGNDLTPDELQKLETLKKQMSDLESKHNDDWGFDHGFTRHDLVDALGELGSAGARDGKPAAEQPKPVCEAPQPVGGDKPPQGGEQPKAGENPDKKPEPAVGDHEYTIKPGDSFWKIAKENLKAQTGHDPSNAEVVKAMNDLAKANGKKLTDTIHPGEKLKVPGPETGNGETPSGQAPERHAPVQKGSGEQPVRNQRPEEETQPVQGEEGYGEQGHGDHRGGHRRGERVAPTPAEHKSAAEVLRSHFSEMDKDGNNHVTKKEIEKYVAEHQKTLTAEETKALDLMAKNVGQIQKLVNDEKGPENSGISRKDLDKLEDLQKVSSQFLGSGKFDSLDTNHNNFLSKDEITKALTTQQLTREERLTLEFLKDNLKLLEKGNNDERGFENNGASLADLRYYANFA